MAATSDAVQSHQSVDEQVAEEQDLSGTRCPPTPDSKASFLSHYNLGDETPDNSSVGIPSAEVEEPQDIREANERVMEDFLPPEDHTVPTQEAIQQSPQEPITEPMKELPPPFYPSETASTPTSATSSSIPSFQAPQNQATMHYPRPSANSIVFGGFTDSSNSSPAPPAGMMGFPPPPPPGFIPGNFGPPPFFTPGHSHHPSDPTGQVPYPPMVVPPPGAFAFRRDHPHPGIMGQSPSWHPSGAHAPYQMAHQDGISPRHGPANMNGAAHPSRSPSQASVKTQDGDFKQRVDRSAERRISELQNGVQGSLAKPKTDDPTNDFVSYLLSQFGNHDFADHILQITHADAEILFSMPVHGVIVARSPTLASAFAASKAIPSKGPLKLVQISSRDKFINGLSFKEALKYLYGGPLPSIVDLSEGIYPFDNNLEVAEAFSVARQRMDQTLSYAAAGYLLQLPSVTTRGIQNAKRLLRWDTVEHALAFALDGGLGSSWGDSPSHRRNISNMEASSQSGNVEDSFPTYEPYSTTLLRDVVEFFAYNFPVTFRLNTTAPQLSENPLLPNFAESRPPTHNPRLSMIRFGEVPLEGAAQPNFVTNVLSSILLSLPFPVLQVLFASYALGGRLGWSAVVEIMRAVVGEREDRRRIALTNLTRTATHSCSDEQLLDNLHWEERVEPSSQHGSGFCLARSRKTAAASMAESGA